MVRSSAGRENSSDFCSKLLLTTDLSFNDTLSTRGLCCKNYLKSDICAKNLTQHIFRLSSAPRIRSKPSRGKVSPDSMLVAKNWFSKATPSERCALPLKAFGGVSSKVSSTCILLSLAALTKLPSIEHQATFKQSSPQSKNHNLRRKLASSDLQARFSSGK